MRCGSCRKTFHVAGLADPTEDAAPPAEKIPEDAAFQTKSAKGRATRRAHRVVLATVTAGIAGIAGIAGLFNTGAMPFEGLMHRAEGIFATILPGLATPKLSFVDLKTRFEGEGPDRALIVEGLIVSDARGPHPLPSMSFEIRGSKDSNEVNESIFRWMIPPPAPIIAQGTPVPFRARLASPPREGKDIVIRLAGA